MPKRTHLPQDDLAHAGIADEHKGFPYRNCRKLPYVLASDHRTPDTL